jgi:type II restriction/modification system DNA methylase subunit YeeA
MVSDTQRIEIHTNFTGLSPVVRVVTLDDLAADDPSSALQMLRDVFVAPEEFRPRIEQAQITEKAARVFAELAQSLRSRGNDPDAVAHFLDRILFCLFAEDAGLLPKGIFQRLAEVSRGRSETFMNSMSELFTKMSNHGGLFGTEEIEWFNGGLFDSGDALLLTGTEINTLLDVSRLNWAKIEPAIFGTLFERGLDPNQRAQLGAHYTDRDAISALVEPVLLRPLRREYVEMQARVTQLLLSGRRVTSATPRTNNPNAIFEDFLTRLRTVRVLDPACGSGNFLVVSLWALKDLEFEAINWGSLVLKRSMQIPQIGPEAVLGIDLNGYAAELARVTIWIGDIQWRIRHGYGTEKPILKRLQHIETRDALLDWSDPLRPVEATWPDAEFIVGNPPFLGNRLFRRAFGNSYTEALWGVYDNRLPHSSDLVCYWHEKARAQIAAKRTTRAGLLATQSIRGGANRRVLERINDSGAIFFARSDDAWVLSGANVHISFVGQDGGSESQRELDGRPVQTINADLTSGIDLTKVKRLTENANQAFMGDIKVGPFDIPPEVAADLLSQLNPDGRSNRDVVRPWANGSDLTGKDRGYWIVDFGLDMSEREAALYEGPFEYVRENVLPVRRKVTAECCRRRWWIHHNARPEMRAALAGLSRYIATPRVSKHRIFVWLDAGVLLDSAAVAIARDDDFGFGVLHSRPHEVWARAMGTQLREVESGFRYTSSTTFETFPFPNTGAAAEQVSSAARNLVALRDGWRTPRDAVEGLRTLTGLYNSMPTWLRNAHADLDDAVAACYGWRGSLTAEDILAALLELNMQRPHAKPSRAEGIGDV